MDNKTKDLEKSSIPEEENFCAKLISLTLVQARIRSKRQKQSKLLAAENIQREEKIAEILQYIKEKCIENALKGEWYIEIEEIIQEINSRANWLELIEQESDYEKVIQRCCKELGLSIRTKKIDKGKRRIVRDIGLYPTDQSPFSPPHYKEEPCLSPVRVITWLSPEVRIINWLTEAISLILVILFVLALIFPFC